MQCLLKRGDETAPEQVFESSSITILLYFPILFKFHPSDLRLDCRLTSQARAGQGRHQELHVRRPQRCPDEREGAGHGLLGQEWRVRGEEKAPGWVEPAREEDHHHHQGGEGGDDQQWKANKVEAKQKPGGESFGCLCWKLSAKRRLNQQMIRSQNTKNDDDES